MKNHSNPETKLQAQNIPPIQKAEENQLHLSHSNHEKTQIPTSTNLLQTKRLF
jgi:hypothetical protein